MTKALVATRVRVQKALQEREAGQGMLEYVGIVVAVAVVLGAAIAIINGWDIAGKMGDIISQVFP